MTPDQLERHAAEIERLGRALAAALKRCHEDTKLAVIKPYAPEVAQRYVEWLPKRLRGMAAQLAKPASEGGDNG